MKFLSTASIVALGLLNTNLASAQTITATAIPTSLYPKILSDLSSYQSSAAGALPVSVLTAYEQFAATANVALAVPTDYSDAVSLINAIATGTPTWLAGAPSPVISAIKSIAAADVSIINKDTSGASGPGAEAAVKVAAIAAAGAVAGVAFLL